MWADVERELADILATQFFPCLKSDPAYMNFLRNAGLFSIPDENALIGWNKDWKKSVPMRSTLSLPSSPTNLSLARQLQLKTAASLAARLIVRDIESLKCMQEKGAKVVVLNEHQSSIYRMWDSTDKNQTRNFWFSHDLLQLAKRESAGQKQSVQEWLRDALAVSYDFGKCDRLARMDISGRVAFPAVEGEGLPMPKNQPFRVENGQRIHYSKPDYWTKLGEKFKGEKTQYYLPFIPPEHIEKEPFPLTQKAAFSAH